MEFTQEPPLHPTAQKLVDTVIEMLKTTSYNNIKSENVLMRSGISRGPLYHHFADFDDLIETAQIQIYRGFLQQITSQLVNVIESATDLETAKSEMHAFIKNRSSNLGVFFTILGVGIYLFYNYTEIISYTVTFLIIEIFWLIGHGASFVLLRRFYK